MLSYALLLWALSTVTVDCAQLYSYTDLGPGLAQAINNAGVVLGRNQSEYPYLYSAGHFSTLPQPTGGRFYAESLNDLGQVAGYVTYNGISNVYLATYSQGALNVTSPSGLVPAAINSNGQIAGELVLTYSTFLYSNGVVTQVGPLPGGLVTAPEGLSANGTVLAESFVNGNVTNGFLYNNGQITPIVPPAGFVSAQMGPSVTIPAK
jgi:hypothetical protein